MMAALLFLAFGFAAIGGVRLFVAFLDYRDARALAAFRAEQLVAWAQLEADVIAAERAIAADDAASGFYFDSDGWHVAEDRHG